MQQVSKKFLLIAGYPDSLLNFRGPLLKALMAEELEVHVAAPDLPADSMIRQQLVALGVVVHEVPLKRTGMNPLVDIKTVYALWRLMRTVKPDFSLGYTIKPVIYGNLAAWFAGVPNRFALITGLGYAFQGEAGERSWLKRIVRGLYRTALGKAHRVFFQNPDDEALFYELGIIKQTTQKTVVVNGSGIDVSSFSLASLPTEPRFLLIARLLGDKGVREYAAAAKQVKAKYPHAHFSLVGWIDENPDAVAQEELDEWVISGTLDFLGKLSDVRPAIAESCVYVLPSYREGTPRTVLEAMAMGRAIITTDAPGCRETVVDGDNGFLVPVKAVDELAAAMERFITEPELATHMGMRSREVAEQKYDVHMVNAHMLHEMGIKDD